MASLITHAFVGAALGQGGEAARRKDWRFWCFLVFGSMLPDIDSLGFFLGVPYGSFWGHRGFTHSLLFAMIVAVVGVLWMEGGRFRSQWKLGILFFLAIASHCLLDAMTNGGLGVAFFSPFDTHRYFLPWRPILVSPIGTARFFSARGMRILANEALWVWLPTLVVAILSRLVQRFRAGARPLSNGQDRGQFC